LCPISITDVMESGTRWMRVSSSSLDARYSSSSNTTEEGPRAGPQHLERFTRARCGGAKDELRLGAEVTKMLRDSLCVASTSRRQRPLTIRERRVSPTRLGVTEEVERAHGL